jgi:hypothetical protein
MTEITLSPNLIDKIIIDNDLIVSRYIELLEKYKKCPEYSCEKLTNTNKKQNLNKRMKYNEKTNEKTNANTNLRDYLLSKEFIETIVFKSWLKHICKCHSSLSPVIVKLLTITENICEITASNISSTIINCINSYCYALTGILTNLEKIQKIIKGDHYKPVYINGSHIITVMDLDKLNIDDNYNKYISRILSALDIQIQELPEYVIDILTIYCIITTFSSIDNYDCLYSLNEFITLDDPFQNKQFKFAYKYIPLLNRFIGMGYCITIGYSIDLKEYILILGGGSDGHEVEYNYDRMTNFFNLDTKNKRRYLKSKNIKKLTIAKAYEFLHNYISEISELTEYSII